MDAVTTVAPILAVLAIGVVSPGPSFVLVAQTAVAQSRAAAAAAAFGMAAGATCFAVAALLGLTALFARVPLAFLALKLAGGVYLLWLAAGIWRRADAPLNVTASAQRARGPWRAFALAAGTMLTNPKAALQYGVIFAAMLPPASSPRLTLVLACGVFLLEAGWYLLVAFALSSARPRAWYLRAKGAIDRVVGGVLSLLGVRVLVSAAE